MNQSIFEYYKKNSDSNFIDVIIVDEKISKTFEELKSLTFNFPKAWYELSKLSITDKIEFSRDFCLKTLPYSPEIYPLIYDFFVNLNDIFVIMTKKKEEQKYLVELVYSIQNDSTFFRGRPPLDSEQIRYVNSQFNDILPSDFLSFLKIHSGFSKNADSGIIPAEDMFDVTTNMIELIESQKRVILSNQKVVDPNDLIFFYQSYQRVDFQCFYSRWFPYSDVGNVYYSYNEDSISNFNDKNTWSENLAFPTFLNWLIFYLEIMDFE
jgi:hypothetical protein